jgi:anti-sigma factor RsiW
MTDPTRPITEEQLHAYVDGWLDADTRAAVERHLAQHPEAASQVRDWQAINAGLRALGSSLEAQPGRPLEWKPAENELAARRARRRPLHRALQVSAVAASLAMGVLTGWMARDYLAEKSEYEQFVKQVAMAYKVFASPIQARPVEMTAEERERLQRWLSHKMSVGFPMGVPQLDREGWNLVGGRLLSNDAGPAALYVYEKSNESPQARPGEKTRIALYVMAKPEPVNKPLTWAKGFPVQICEWGQDRLLMALAGPVEREQMKKLLTPINKQIIASAGVARDGALSRVPPLPAPPLAVSLNGHR